jgi:hypothetical protein
VHRNLGPLDYLHGPQAALPYGVQILVSTRALPQFSGKQIRGGDSVLNGEVDPHAAHRRHGMRRIADT